MYIQTDCPQFLTDDHWKMSLLLALHPLWQVLTLQYIKSVSDTIPGLADLMPHASVVRDVAKVVPTKILPLFLPLLENQGFR